MYRYFVKCKIIHYLVIKNLEPLLMVSGLKKVLIFHPPRFVFRNSIPRTLLSTLFEYFFEILFQGIATKVFSNNHPFRIN